MPIAIKPGTLAELQRQFGNELTNAHAYQALAIWCDNENFKGFAEYFYKQAEEERGHGKKLAGHLLDRGIVPAVAAIPAPKTSFASLTEIARQAQAMEAATTQGIYAAYETALKENDYPAQILLQWFISEQVEEEAWTAEMVDRLAGATCAGSLGELDRHIVRYLTKGE